MDGDFVVRVQMHGAYGSFGPETKETVDLNNLRQEFRCRICPFSVERPEAVFQKLIVNDKKRIWAFYCEGPSNYNGPINCKER